MTKTRHHRSKSNRAKATIWEKKANRHKDQPTSNPAIEHLKAMQKEQWEQKEKLIQTLEVDNPLVFLFDSAVILEGICAQTGDVSQVQSAITGLSKLIEDVFSKKQLQSKGGLVGETVEILPQRLAHFCSVGLDGTLSELLNLYQVDGYLNTLEQVDSHDEYCELIWHEEGCIRTRIKSGQFECFQRYILDGLKYNNLGQFYCNIGTDLSFELARRGHLKPQGGTDEDIMASLRTAALQISAREFLEHYGVEAEFDLDGVHYHRDLLLVTFSLLMSHAQSKYLAYWEERRDQNDTPTRIQEIWSAYIKDGGKQIPGPLSLDIWDNMVDRVYEVCAQGQYTRSQIEAHLNFFVTDLNEKADYVNIQERPLLKIGNTVAYFMRPLAMQYPWMPVLLPLIKAKCGKQPHGAQKRVKRSTSRLGALFRKQGFEVCIDLLLEATDSEGRKQKATDVDILALKDGHLFIIQMKMTYPRADVKGAKTHKDNALIKGGEQAEKSRVFLEEHWVSYRSSLKTQQTWQSLTIIPLVVSTSFEYDRSRFSGHLKISQFELERYLNNDAYLCFEDDDTALAFGKSDPEPYLFYPLDTVISGGRLKELIEQDQLWRNLYPDLQATDADRFLPSIYLPNTSAAEAGQSFVQGNESYNAQDLDQAVELYQKAISLYPKQEKFHKGLGNALALLGKQSSSLAHFDQAIHLNPYYGEAYNTRGQTYMELNQFEEAYSDLKNAVKYAPYDITAWQKLAQLEMFRGIRWHLPDLQRRALASAQKGLYIYQRLAPECRYRQREAATVLRGMIQPL